MELCLARANETKELLRGSALCVPSSLFQTAAHVRVLRNTTVEGMKAFLVEVPEQYLPVTSATPQLENIAVIKTSSPEGCGDCLDAKVVVGTEYLFAGHLQCTADQVTWVLDLSDCLISDWISKYRRLSKWVKFSTAESNC